MKYGPALPPALFGLSNGANLHSTEIKLALTAHVCVGCEESDRRQETSWVASDGATAGLALSQGVDEGSLLGMVGVSSPSHHFRGTTKSHIVPSILPTVRAAKHALILVRFPCPDGRLLSHTSQSILRNDHEPPEILASSIDALLGAPSTT